MSSFCYVVKDEVSYLIEDLIEGAGVGLAADDCLPLLGPHELEEIVGRAHPLDGISQDMDPSHRADQISEMVTGGAPARTYVLRIHRISGQLLGDESLGVAVISRDGVHVEGVLRLR